MKYTHATVALMTTLTLSLTAWAQHAHTHPDIELELEGTELHVHGPSVIHNHEHYEFIDTGSNWQTFHDTLNWPGVSGEEGFSPSDSGTTFDLVTQSELYYWDATGPVGSSNFSAVTGNTYVEVSDAGFVSSIQIDSNTAPKTLSTIASVNGSGEIHTHPIWRLFDNDANPLTDPADGAYFFLFYIDPSDASWSNTDVVGLLLHKGLTEAQYEAAAESAGSQFNLTIPEPASVILLGLGASAVVLRRKR